MKKKRYITYWLTLLILLTATTACKKLLEEKSDQKLVVPNSLNDFQALLDNFGVMTGNDLISSEVSADDYYLSDADFAALASEQERRMYTWEKDNIFEPGSNDWLYAYKAVYYCNSVLEGLETGTLARDANFNNVKGQALVFRAKCLLQALGLWGKAYAIASPTDLGIPLRTNTDFNQASVRAPLKAGYEKIVQDLKAAAALLPDKQPSSVRPSKAAAYGLLARTLLYMGDYDRSEKYADSCLALSPELLDYNKLTPSERYPFVLFNPEVIFNTFRPPSASLSSTRAKIVPELIASYQPNDLRKNIYYLQTGTFYYFKGTYFQPALFFGLASDEMYLTLAECQIRTSKVALGMQTLNKLLVNRFKTGSFVPLMETGQTAALSVVLSERRKELVMRGLRWMDIKRLNAEGQNLTLTRNLSGKSYQLAPNDKRYALAIPEDIITLTGMPQNPRD